MTHPGVLVRLTGQPPIGAKVYYLQKLRCNLCGKVFTAAPPAGVGDEKYDATVGSMIALLKYGTGMPFNRAEKLQGNLGIPLPASTQWDIVRDQAERVEPAFAELLDQAAQGDVLYNDDTTVKILELMGTRGGQAALTEDAAATATDSAEVPAEDAAAGSVQEAQGGAHGHVHLGHRARRATAAGSRCSSAAASTPARTSRTC